MRSILILTAGFGEGHNAAARSLKDALSTAHPESRVEIVDVFAEAYGWVNTASIRGYLFVINKTPGLWSMIFHWLHRSNTVSKNVRIFGRAINCIREKVQDLSPDVVVSTYPGYGPLLEHACGGASDRRFWTVTIVTDSITINRIWHAGHSDFFLVPNDHTASVLKEQGVAEDWIRVTGFPVATKFEALRQTKVPPAEGEKWKVLFMVNSGKNIAPEVACRLANLANVSLTVTVGRDDVLQKRIESELVQRNLTATFYGWTDQISRLIAEAHLVVSKAGGATVQECLAAVSPMVISQVVPGQEEGNATLIVESGAGCIAVTPEAIATAVSKAIENNGGQWQEWSRSAEKLSRPEAARSIADWLLSLGDYGQK